MDLGLTDRVYVLTGASRGLGYATAECLVADGAKVVLSARDADEVRAAATRLGGPAHAVGIAGDLADAALPQRLVDTARDRFGRLDGALVSVGGPPPGSAAGVSDEQWRQSFETVFLGTVRALRTVAAALAENARAEGRELTDRTRPASGAIALVLSTSARYPVTGLGISNGLRPGLAGVAKDVADEYGPRGVRVVGLLPGRIMTDRNRQLLAASGDAERARAEAEAGIPLRRIGAPAEFGRVAAFVLSPAAGYLTGVTIPVDGGATRDL